MKFNDHRYFDCASDTLKRKTETEEWMQLTLIYITLVFLGIFSRLTGYDTVTLLQ